MDTLGTSNWPKRIKVDRKIVNILSRSIYADFPRTIREMVSNSYDADATVVRIELDLKNDEMWIQDNGNGMSVEQFDNYLRIAGEKYEGRGASPKFQRKRIGRFGVGFLAAFPFCDKIEITSKNEGSENGFIAVIPTKRFVEGAAVEAEDVSSIPVDGYSVPSPGGKDDHFTKIRLFGLNTLVDEYFHIRSERRRLSIQSWDGMERLKWNLCDTLPLDYKSRNSEVALCLGGESVGMEVWLNGERLYRNDFGGQVIESTEQTFIKLGSLSFKYAITTNWSIIHPVEARGLKIRINGVGVGPRTFMEIEKEIRTFSRLNWLTGEVHILEGLEESLSVTRDSFIWTPDYQVLKDFCQNALLRAHTKVERVAEVERDVSYALDDKYIPTISTRELIDKSVKQLGNSGFDIIHKRKHEVKEGQGPLIIDKARKLATVVDDHPSLEEEGSRYGLGIRQKPFGDRSRDPLRLADDGVVEINTSYPLFEGKTKGDIMKRVHFWLYQAKKACKTVDEMYDYLVEHFRKEFESR